MDPLLEPTFHLQAASKMIWFKLEELLANIDDHRQCLIIAHKALQTETLDETEMKAHEMFLDDIERVRVIEGYSLSFMGSSGGGILLRTQARSINEGF